MGCRELTFANRSGRGAGAPGGRLAVLPDKRVTVRINASGALRGPTWACVAALGGSVISTCLKMSQKPSRNNLGRFFTINNENTRVFCRMLLRVLKHWVGSDSALTRSICIVRRIFVWCN